MGGARSKELAGGGGGSEVDPAQHLSDGEGERDENVSLLTAQIIKKITQKCRSKL